MNRKNGTYKNFRCLKISYIQSIITFHQLLFSSAAADIAQKELERLKTTELYFCSGLVDLMFFIVKNKQTNSFLCKKKHVFYVFFLLFFIIFPRENTFISKTSIFIEESYTFLLHVDR